MAWPPKPAFGRIDDAVKGGDWVRVGSVLWPLSFCQGHKHPVAAPPLAGQQELEWERRITGNKGALFFCPQ